MIKLDEMGFGPLESNVKMNRDGGATVLISQMYHPQMLMDFIAKREIAYRQALIDLGWAPPKISSESPAAPDAVACDVSCEQPELPFVQGP